MRKLLTLDAGSPAACGRPASCFDVFHVFANTLQNTGMTMPSLILNLSRQGLLFVPVLVALEAVLGLDGLLWAQPVMDGLAAALTIPCYRKMVNKW